MFYKARFVKASRVALGSIPYSEITTNILKSADDALSGSPHSANRVFCSVVRFF